MNSNQHTPFEIKYPILFWIKKNLFSNLFNSILSLLTFFLVFQLIKKGVLPLIEKDWSVIPNNLKLILVGSYPQEKLYRVWIVVCYLFLFMGATFSYIKSQLSMAGKIIILSFLILGMLPFSTMNRIFCLSNAVLFILGFYLTQKINRKNKTLLLIIAWLIFIPFAFILVSGFGFHRVKSNYWGGLLLSMLISLTTILVSFPLGLLLALGRRSKLKLIKLICTLTIEIIRGVPLITILFIGYLIIPLALPSYLNPSVFTRAVFGIILFHSAYMAENFRGGLQGISNTQYEAASSLGFSSFHTMILIILPQVLKRMIPVLVSQFTGILKDTSLVSIIGLLDLIGISTAISSNPQYMTSSTQVLTFLAFIYFILCYSISGASYKLEKKLDNEK